MNIKHIFFDLDHTLWDFEKNSSKAFAEVFKKNNISVSVTKFLNYYPSVNLRYWRLYRNERVTKEALRYGRLKDTFDILKYKITDEEINQLADDYLHFLPKFNYVFDGTYEILDYLKPKYQMHIITNGFSEVQNLKLKNSKLDNYFDKIITSEQVGVKKPNPKVFKFALSLAEAKSRESIMIGDSWEADIMGAKNYGMHVIFCNFNNVAVDESIHSVSNLLEIKKYL